MDLIFKLSNVTSAGHVPFCSIQRTLHRGVGSMSAMGAWAPINISSGVTNGCQHTVLQYLLLKRSRYSNRAVNDSNKAVTLATFFCFWGLQLYHWAPIN